jgi:hypothetical protein
MVDYVNKGICIPLDYKFDVTAAVQRQFLIVLLVLAAAFGSTFLRV